VFAASVFRLQVRFRRGRIHRPRGDRARCWIGWLRPGIARGCGRPWAVHALRFDRVDNKSVPGPPKRHRALPAQPFEVDDRGGTPRRRLPCSHHKRRASAVVGQRVRPYRQRHKPAVGQRRYTSLIIAGDAGGQRSIADLSRVSVGGQPFLDQKGVLGTFDQMQPSILAADAEIVAIAGDQDIRLRL
jgi:hypothetical protein